MQLARGAGVNLVGEVLGLAGAPLLYLAISWLVGPAVLGRYIMATTCLAVALRLVVLGLDKGVLRHVPLAATKTNRERAFNCVVGTALRWSLALSVIVALAAIVFPQLLSLVEGATQPAFADLWLPALAAALPGQALTQVILHVLRGWQVMWVHVAVRNVLQPVSLLVFSLFPLALGLAEGALVIGYVLAAYLSAACAFAFFRRYFAHQTLADLLTSPRDGELLRFSLPQGITETLNFLLWRIDILLIHFFFPERPELLAFYGMAALLAGSVKKIRLAFDLSFSPLFAKLCGRGDQQAMVEHFRTVGRWIFSLYLPVAVGVVFCAQPLLSLYGEGFARYWPVVPILVAGRLLNAAGGPAQAALLMSGRSKLELVNNLLINAGNVCLNLLLIPRFHVYGAAAATAISLTLFNSARLVQVATLLRIWVSPRAALRVLVAAALAALPGVYLLGAVDSPGSGLSGTLVFFLLYPPALFLVGSGDDLRLLARWLVKFRTSRPQVAQAGSRR